MADIDLELNGDSTGAVQALSSTAVATNELSGATQDLRGEWAKAEQAAKQQEADLGRLKAGFMAVGAVAVKFGIDSVKAYAEAEKVSRQLERAAGDLSGAFEQQADALESQLHIDGELIKQQQTLLLQWGASPGQIEPTIRAIEDYAAATGKDALTATMELIKGVETGGAKFKALGVQYEEVGNKTQNLTALTQALTDKFGGAAAANANSLQGGLDAVSIAFGNVKEAFGGVIASMESKIGVLDKVANALQGIARNISGQGSLAGAIGALSTGNLLTAAAVGVLSNGPVAPDLSSTGIVMQPAAIHLPGFDPNNPTGGKPKATTKAGRTDDDRLADAKKFYDGLDQIEEHALAQERERYVAELELSADAVEGAEKEAAARVKVRQDMLLQIEKDAAAHAEKMAKEEQKALEKSVKDSSDRAAKKAQEAQQAGDQIGAAFVNALTDQLAKLAAGGEFDAALFVGDILAAAVGIAGTVIGSAFGMPAVGGALGNLAAMGVRAGASAISKSGKKKATTYHDGGWVGAPRYHDGTWVGFDEQRAILQNGERVLSRQEVHHIGGPQAVDNMARGGSRVTLNVTAIDTKSFADSMSGNGGDGLKQAIKRGHGALPALFGSPR